MYTGNTAVRIWPLTHGPVHGRVYGPRPRLCTRRCNGRVHGPYTKHIVFATFSKTVVITSVNKAKCHIACHARARTMYTAVTRPRMSRPFTRPCTGVYTCIHGPAHGRVCTRPAHTVIYTCTRPVQGRGHGRVRTAYSAVTRRCTGREHGRLHGRVRP